MRFLLLIGLMLGNICFGSSVGEGKSKITFDNGDKFACFNAFKEAFALHFCIKAVEQNNPAIECRCGEYGFGQDWKRIVKTREIPCISVSTDYHFEVASAVAHDMVYHLDDIADWLKQNAH